MKVTVLLALVSATSACCGLSFTTCCQAYAPPRIIGYERIPLYAKVPVQQAPPQPGYAVAPLAPVAPPAPGPIVTNPPIVVQDTGSPIMSNYAGPGQVVQTGQIVGQPVVQSVMIQESPAYIAATPIVVQEVPQRLSYSSYAVSPLAGNTGIVSNNIPAGVASNTINTIDYNSPIAVPTARALKLRRSFLKQVKV